MRGRGNGTAWANEQKGTAMSRLRALPTGAWIAIGLVMASIMAPVAAVAATSLVGIVGPNNVRATVTNAGQLKTVEAGPSSMQVYARNGVVAGSCLAVTTSVGDRGYVAKQIVFNVYDDPSPGVSDFVALYTNASCDPTVSQPVAIVNPASVNAWTYPLDPGFAIQPGGGLYAQAFGNVKSDVMVYGYTVVPADVPSTTPISTPTP